MRMSETLASMRCIVGTMVVLIPQWSVLRNFFKNSAAVLVRTHIPLSLLSILCILRKFETSKQWDNGALNTLKLPISSNIVICFLTAVSRERCLAETAL